MPAVASLPLRRRPVRWITAAVVVVKGLLHSCNSGISSTTPPGETLAAAPPRDDQELIGRKGRLSFESVRRQWWNLLQFGSRGGRFACFLRRLACLLPSFLPYGIGAQWCMGSPRLSSVLLLPLPRRARPFQSLRVDVKIAPSPLELAPMEPIGRRPPRAAAAAAALRRPGGPPCRLPRGQ